MAWKWPKWRAVLLDFMERAGWSAGQVFVATLLAGGTAVAGLPWKYAATLGISAAVASVVLTAGQYLAKLTNLSFWQDLLVRLVKTFVGSFAGSFAAGVFDITTFDWGTAFNVAFLAVLAALGKGLLAREQPAPQPAPPAQQPAPEPAPGPAKGPAAVPVSPSTLSGETYKKAVGPG